MGNGSWRSQSTGEIYPGPEPNEIVTAIDSEGAYYLLEGYPKVKDVYDKFFFVPIDEFMTPVGSELVNGITAETIYIEEKIFI